MDSGPHGDDQPTDRSEAIDGSTDGASTDPAKDISLAIDRAVREFVEDLQRRHTG